jgi:hypothetical protein
MESLVMFLEEYWGYTLFGGMTVGMLVLNIWAFLKSSGILKYTGGLVDSSIKRVGEYGDKFKEMSALVDTVMAGFLQSEAEKKQYVEENQYLQKVIGTYTKALTYLIMASKLTLEDKYVLQKEFETLERGKPAVPVVEKSPVKNLEDLPEPAKETAVKPAPEIVSKNEVKTIMERYNTGEGGV